MALTPEVFLRDLPRAMGNLAYRVEGHEVTAGTAEHGLSISLRPLPPRRLSALLSLERSEVAIEFRGFAAQEQAAFLERFYRAYQRGGG